MQRSSVVGAWGLVLCGAIGCASGPRPADELAALPAAAARDSALGRCPGSQRLDIGPVADVVTDPQHGVRRIDDPTPVIFDSTDHVLVRALGRPYSQYFVPGATYATAVAIIDTAGRVVPGSVVVTQSDGMQATRSVCATVPLLEYKAARQDGRKVRALYSEQYVFFDPDPRDFWYGGWGMGYGW